MTPPPPTPDPTPKADSGAGALLRRLWDYYADENEVPPHDCEFKDNPEAGKCDFHELWGEIDALMRANATPPQSDPALAAAEWPKTIEGIVHQVVYDFRGILNEAQRNRIAESIATLISRRPLPAPAPAPEAGAIRRHTWSKDGERCEVCGAKDWMSTPGGCVPPGTEAKCPSCGNGFLYHNCGDPFHSAISPMPPAPEGRGETPAVVQPIEYLTRYTCSVNGMVPAEDGPWVSFRQAKAAQDETQRERDEATAANVKAVAMIDGMRRTQDFYLAERDTLKTAHAAAVAQAQTLREALKVELSSHYCGCVFKEGCSNPDGCAHCAAKARITAALAASEAGK